MREREQPEAAAADAARMRIVLFLALAACGDNHLEALPDAGQLAAIDPTSCDGLEAITEPAPDIGEVLLATRVITPGVSYTCDGATTWTYWSRRRVDNGEVGSYGKFKIGSTDCAWFAALDTRS